MVVVLVVVGLNNPTPSPWTKQLLVLDEERVGAFLEPVFLTKSQFIGCQNGVSEDPENQMYLKH